MSTPKIGCVVVGAAGRMGQRLCQLMLNSDRFRIAGATEQPDSRHIGKTLQEALGLPIADVRIAAGLGQIGTPFDVIVDFTFPGVSLQTALFAGRTGTPAVIGSTGFSSDQTAELQRLAAQFPCVWAPNMSMGVNTLFKLVEEVALILRDGFDVEILEMHHRHKKDAPSGTAARIAQIVAAANGWNLDQAGVYQRKGVTGERRNEEIGIQALRGGDVVGEHMVLFAGNGERLELVHRAQSRDCFAQGALHAAQWVMGKPHGLYDMQDVLGLKAPASR
jgi:4-hydroxy-tetrahydrodipicolinate reductase